MAEKENIHFVGIGGVGTGSLAVALSEAGHLVTGSDNALYEPMKSVMASAMIKMTEGYRAETLSTVNPSTTIIGNVVRRENPEASAWLQSGQKFVSFPEAVRQFVIEDKLSIVCAGTHGKTTTTSWVAFLLSELGANPSYLIGGVPKDLDRGCKITDGKIFVGEGDEYDSAFFDKGPKFLHYNPGYLILANIEFDHADIYRDLDHVKSSFEKLIAILPGDGLCVARADDPVVMEVIRGALCPVQTFGMGNALWKIGKVEEDRQGFLFEVLYRNRSAGVFRTPMFGEHNLLNILSGMVCAVNLGYTMDKIRPIVERFHGARRRQEVLMDSPIVVVDDFAHHPTEVLATLKAVRRRYPEGKLWAFFEPRSATARRSTHQAAYEKAFDSADEILICSPFHQKELAESDRFSSETLVESLNARGRKAACFPTPDEMVERFRTEQTVGDIVVVMSNGEFGKIQSKILGCIRN